jgi:hypothetical protein
MTEEDSTRREPGDSYYIPPQTSPVRKDPGPADRKKVVNEWLGLAYVIIGLFILVAAFQLYFTLQELIRTWISDQFVPVVSALYYAAVIVTGVWLIHDYLRRH